MSTREVPESGLFAGRVEFYRENTTGQFNTGASEPSYTFFSDNPRSVNHSPGLNIERRDGLGTPDAVDHDIGNEEPEIEVVYDLQRQLVDGAPDPDDPAGDAWQRDGDNRIKNTHHVRIREDRSNADPDDPSNTSGARVYVIGQGGHPDCDLELDPENGEPVQVTITYSCEKVREYEIFQPDSEQLSVESTDSNDTTQSVTIEDDNGTAESITLNGTTPTTTTKSDWSSIRAIELDSETDGDVIILETNGANELARIRGASYYATGDGSLEGDLGVPQINGGSLATAVGNAYEYFNGASVTRGGNALSYDLNRMTASVENNYNGTPRHDSTRYRYNEGNRAATLEADLVGWGASVQYHDEALGLNEADIVVTLTSTKLTFSSAIPMEPGDKERGPDDSAIEYGVTFEPSNDDGVSLAQP